MTKINLTSRAASLGRRAGALAAVGLACATVAASTASAQAVDPTGGAHGCPQSRHRSSPAEGSRGCPGPMAGKRASGRLSRPGGARKTDTAAGLNPVPVRGLLIDRPALTLPARDAALHDVDDLLGVAALQQARRDGRSLP